MLRRLPGRAGSRGARRPEAQPRKRLEMAKRNSKSSAKAKQEPKASSPASMTPAAGGGPASKAEQKMPRGLRKQLRRLERDLSEAARLESKRVRKLERARHRRQMIEAVLGELRPQKPAVSHIAPKPAAAASAPAAKAATARTAGAPKAAAAPRATARTRTSAQAPARPRTTRPRTTRPAASPRRAAPKPPAKPAKPATPTETNKP
jgi:hypothetical protein